MSQAVPLRSIQILRALAACLVLFGHCLHDAQYIAEKTARLPLNISFLDWGFGVDIFFVISGFIMVYTTADIFGRPGAARVFLMRRIVRVVPLYWMMTAGIVLVSLVAPTLLNVSIEGWRSVATSMLFIPDLRANGEIRPILALGWSLNYEMFFYVVFACCLMLPLKRAMLCLIAFFVGISILGETVTLPTTALAFWTNSIILEFLFGGLLALACRANLSVSLGGALALFGIGAALAIALGPLWGTNDFLPRFIWGGLPATIIVAAAAFGPRLSGSWIVSPLVVLGDASYSLYLTHPFVIRPLRNIWMSFHGGTLPLGLYVMLCAIVAIGASIIVYRLVEKPTTNVLRRRSDGLTRLPVEPMVAPKTSMA